MSNNNFQNLKTVQKGNLAEEYAVNFLEGIGYTLWWNTNNKATIYDGLGYSGATRNLFEVKTKTKTKYGTYSIHENDLIKYEQAELEENKKMIILYVDAKAGELNITTTKTIRDTVKLTQWDIKEKKTLIYFDGFKTKKKLPVDVCEMLNAVKI